MKIETSEKYIAKKTFNEVKSGDTITFSYSNYEAAIKTDFLSVVDVFHNVDKKVVTIHTKVLWSDNPLVPEGQRDVFLIDPLRPVREANGFCMGIDECSVKKLKVALLAKKFKRSNNSKRRMNKPYGGL